jgi:hypothetical protein
MERTTKALLANGSGVMAAGMVGAASAVAATAGAHEKGSGR